MFFAFTNNLRYEAQCNATENGNGEDCQKATPFRNSEILKENILEKEKYWKISEFHAVDTVYAPDLQVFTTTSMKNTFFFRNGFVSLFLYLDYTVYEYYYKIKAFRIFCKVQQHKIHFFLSSVLIKKNCIIKWICIYTL